MSTSEEFIDVAPIFAESEEDEGIFKFIGADGLAAVLIE
jgi:hypothetical protein